MTAAAAHKAPLVDSLATVTQPVVYGVAGLSFLGITFQDWVLIGTAVLLAFNIVFAVVKLRDLIRGVKRK